MSLSWRLRRRVSRRDRPVIPARSLSGSACVPNIAVSFHLGILLPLGGIGSGLALVFDGFCLLGFVGINLGVGGVQVQAVVKQRQNKQHRLLCDGLHPFPRLGKRRRNPFQAFFKKAVVSAHSI